MKILKLLLPLFFIFCSINFQAQKKQEKKAKKITAEITKALQLSDKESKYVYKIQLEKFKEAKRIREEYANNESAKKKELKKNGNKVYNEMKKTLGKERMKKWKEYRKSTKNK